MQPPDHDLEQVRSELRRLGYLDHGVERFLLQDALRPRRPGRTLLLLTFKVGLLAGVVLSLGLALALVTANAGPRAGAFDVVLDTVALFLHLFPPISAAAALAFLALCGVLLLVLRVYHVRRIETLSFAAAAAAGAGGLALALWGARALLAESHLPLVVVLGLATPVAIYLVIKLVYNGLLTLAIRFTDSAPGVRLFSRRWLGLAILSAAFVLTLPAVLSARRPPPPDSPAGLPSAPGERVLLIGVDGVLPEEVDYLLAVGDLPALAALARQGGALWSYARREEPPASFWTSVATGLPGPAHGVASLDSFRPLGMSTPLSRSGPLRAWWSGVEVPLGLAEYRPLLSNRRSAFTVWELASRGGAPVLAVNWWATFPAEPLPGLVVAHGAYQLLREGAQGAVAPESARPELMALAREAARPPSTFPPSTSPPTAGTGATWPSPTSCARSCAPWTCCSAARYRASARSPWSSIPAGVRPAGPVGRAGSCSGGGRGAPPRGSGSGCPPRRWLPACSAPSGCRRAPSSRRPLPNACGRSRPSRFPAMESAAGNRFLLPKGANIWRACALWDIFDRRFRVTECDPAGTAQL